jgi:hypothetical protein
MSADFGLYVRTGALPSFVGPDGVPGGRWFRGF